MNHDAQGIFKDGRTIKIQGQAAVFTQELGEGKKSTGEKTKVCRECLIQKQIYEFHMNKSVCKQCKKDHDKGRIRGEYKPRSNWTVAARARKRRWASKGIVDPIKSKARRTLRTAMQSGAIKRPTVCEMCSNGSNRIDGRSGIQGHHYKGYEFTLEVKWLCPKCHKKEEATERKDA